MPEKVRMRPTESMPERLRKKVYSTRHLVADDVFAVSERDARWLSRAQWAEEAVDEPTAQNEAPRRRPGRPRKAETTEVQADQPQRRAKTKTLPVVPEEPELVEKTVPELREMAEEQGVDLPSGYIRKDELVRLVDNPDEPQSEE